VRSGPAARGCCCPLLLLLLLLLTPLLRLPLMLMLVRPASCQH
jgi:hypothetical protein